MLTLSAEQTNETREAMNIHEKLQYWSSHCVVGRIVASNIPRERFLPGKAKDSLLNAIDSVAWGTPPTRTDIDATANAYRSRCHVHAREGGEAPVHVASELLGRAVEFNAFAESLADSFPAFFYTAEDARDFLLRLSCGDPLSAGEQKLTMSTLPRSAWATWDDDKPGGDPFAFSSNVAERVRACIGLNPIYRDKDGLLLLIFRRPVGLPMFRPTIADAALYLFFEPPAPPEDEHGLTRPWLPGMCPFPIDELTPRPELVHTPIEFLQVSDCRLIA